MKAKFNKKFNFKVKTALAVESYNLNNQTSGFNSHFYNHQLRSNFIRVSKIINKFYLHQVLKN
jgi:hypothetical protein